MKKNLMMTCHFRLAGEVPRLNSISLFGYHLEGAHQRRVYAFIMNLSMCNEGINSEGRCLLAFSIHEAYE